MQELVKLLSEKTGISEETARMAIQIVAGYTKDKLPEPIGGMVNQFLQSGEMPDMSNLAGLMGGAGNLLGGLGGMLGGDKK